MDDQAVDPNVDPEAEAEYPELVEPDEPDEYTTEQPVGDDPQDTLEADDPLAGGL